jgi:hypothetical protein
VFDLKQLEKLGASYNEYVKNDEVIDNISVLS